MRIVNASIIGRKRTTSTTGKDVLQLELLTDDGETIYDYVVLDPASEAAWKREAYEKALLLGGDRVSLTTRMDFGWPLGPEGRQSVTGIAPASLPCPTCGSDL